MGAGASTTTLPVSDGTKEALAALPEAAQKELLGAYQAKQAETLDPNDVNPVPDLQASQLSACDMLKQIQTGTTTCAAFAERLYARIDACNETTGAYLIVTPKDEVMEKAAAVDAKVKAGESLRIFLIWGLL